MDPNVCIPTTSTDNSNTGCSTVTETSAGSIYSMSVSPEVLNKEVFVSTSISPGPKTPENILSH